MQKIIKNRDGITVAALVATIVVLLILVGVGVNYGLTEIRTVNNKKMETELQIVQEGVMQRYALIQSKNGLGITAPILYDNAKSSDGSEISRPDSLVGTRICESNYITNNGFYGITPLKVYDKGDGGLMYEDYYYELDNDGLARIGVRMDKDEGSKKPERKYIVNYATGEIFDLANKYYYTIGNKKGELVYLQPTKVEGYNKSSEDTNKDVTYDFNDD